MYGIHASQNCIKVVIVQPSCERLLDVPEIQHLPRGGRQDGSSGRRLRDVPASPRRGGRRGGQRDGEQRARRRVEVRRRHGQHASREVADDSAGRRDAAAAAAAMDGRAIGPPALVAGAFRGSVNRRDHEWARRHDSSWRSARRRPSPYAQGAAAKVS